jgi:2-oxoisovalerate dehydrogenase E1 component
MINATNQQSRRDCSAVPRLSHYETMATIRAVEEALLDSFSSKVLRGTTHTSLGQEAIAVAAMSMMDNIDIVFSNHRCHGHFLAYCGDVSGLLAEIAGRREGVSQGIGGSQHLHVRRFFSNGVLGGTVPVATGTALAEKVLGTKAITVCFMGDGALGEGVVYESLNMASLWNVPILFIVENNRYAQSTPVELNLAGSITRRFEAFGIETSEIESNDIGELLPKFEFAFRYVRENQRPHCLTIHTYRLGPHSKGDDTRDPEEIASWKRKDPLLLAERYFTAGEVLSARERAAAEVRTSLTEVMSSPAGASIIPPENWDFPNISTMANPWMQDSGTLLVNHINHTLHTLFERDKRVVLIGEDLLDPYSGAFKVSKGLSTRYPGRVLSSPVSEAGIMGLANGMALQGLRPIVELMFGDFSTLILDQTLNHATKFELMYGGQVRCPVIVRAPMGGYRGYGPTHSQTLEKFFIGVPGLTTVACDPLHDQGLIWERMLELGRPCFYIENKVLYASAVKTPVNGKIDGFHCRSVNSFFPTAMLQMSPFDGHTQPDVVVLAYGGMTSLALSTAKRLFIDEEVTARVIIPSQISPLPMKDLSEAIGSCKRVVTIEEGTRRAGWGSEVLASLMETVPGITGRRAAALDTIIAASKLGEEAVLPSEESVYSLVQEILHAF